MTTNFTDNPAGLPVSYPVVARLICIALGALCLSIVGTEARAASKELALVIYHSESPNLRDAQAAEALDVGAEVLEVRHSSEVFSSEGEFDVFGNGGVSDCRDGTARVLSEVVDDAFDLLLQDEADQAAILLQQAEDRLACQRIPLGAPAISGLFYMKGMSLFALERANAAAGAFDLAVAADPGIPGNPNLSAAGNQALEEARTRLQAAEPIDVLIVMATRERREVRIDGRTVESPSVELRPGRHLVQLVASSNTRSFVFDLEGEQSSAVLVHRSGHSRALQMAATDARLRAYATAVIDPLLQSSQVDRADFINVEAPLDESSGWIYRLSSRSFLPRSNAEFSDRREAATVARGSSTTVADLRERRRGSEGVRGFFGVNFGVHVNVFPRGPEVFPYFTLPIGLSLAMKEGFGFDLGIELGFSSWEDEVSQASRTVLAPWGRFGLGYHHPRGVVRPLVSGIFLVSVDDKLGPLRAVLGGAVMAGVDLIVRDPFAIRVVADVGYTTVGFHFAVHAGPGFIF